jgi:hypothetical protein
VGHGVVRITRRFIVLYQISRLRLFGGDQSHKGGGCRPQL